MSLAEAIPLRTKYLNSNWAREQVIRNSSIAWWLQGLIWELGNPSSGYCFNDFNYLMYNGTASREEIESDYPQYPISQWLRHYPALWKNQIPSAHQAEEGLVPGAIPFKVNAETTGIKDVTEALPSLAVLWMVPKWFGEFSLEKKMFSQIYVKFVNNFGSTKLHFSGIDVLSWEKNLDNCRQSGL